MPCMNCGKKISEGANFCKYCGNSITNISESHATAFTFNEGSKNPTENTELPVVVANEEYSYLKQSQNKDKLKKVGELALGTGMLAFSWVYSILSIIVYALTVLSSLYAAINLFNEGHWIWATLVLFVFMPIGLALVQYFLMLTVFLALIAGALWAITRIFNGSADFTTIYGNVGSLFWLCVVLLGVGYGIYAFFIAYRQGRITSFLKNYWWVVALLLFIGWLIFFK